MDVVLEMGQDLDDGVHTTSTQERVANARPLRWNGWRRCRSLGRRHARWSRIHRLDRSFRTPSTGRVRSFRSSSAGRLHRPIHSHRETVCDVLCIHQYFTKISWIADEWERRADARHRETHASPSSIRERTLGQYRCRARVRYAQLRMELPDAIQESRGFPNRVLQLFAHVDRFPAAVTKRRVTARVGVDWDAHDEKIVCRCVLWVTFCLVYSLALPWSLGFFFSKTCDIRGGGSAVNRIACAPPAPICHRRGRRHRGRCGLYQFSTYSVVSLLP